MTDNLFLIDQGDVAPQSDFFLASISSANSTAGTATVLMDGMTEPSEKAYKTLGSAWPLAAGDRVVLLKQSGTYLILGRIGTGSGGNTPEPSETTPLMDGTATAGTEDEYARGDHVHPTDTSRADVRYTVSDVSYDATTHKLKKTIDGTQTDVVTIPQDDGNAEIARSIPVGARDASSTASALIVSVADFAEESALRDGLIFCMYTGTGGGTSSSGFTMAVNDFGAKPVKAANGQNLESGLMAQRWYLFWYTSDSGGYWVAGQLTDYNTTYFYKLLTPTRVSSLPSGVSIATMTQAYQFGYVTNLCFTITRSTTELSSRTQIWSGLPMPPSYNTLHIVCAASSATPPSRPLDVYVTGAGAIEIEHGAAASGSVSYYVNITYIAKEIL